MAHFKEINNNTMYYEITMIIKAVNGKHFYQKHTINDHSLAIEFNNEVNMITACSKTIYYKKFTLTDMYDTQLAHKFSKLVKSHYITGLRNSNKNNRKKSLHNNFIIKEQRTSPNLF